MIQELHCLPEKEQSSSQNNYNLIGAIDDVWDQIGDLTSGDLSSSMAKQAAMLCKHFKEEE